MTLIRIELLHLAGAAFCRPVVYCLSSGPAGDRFRSVARRVVLTEEAVATHVEHVALGETMNEQEWLARPNLPVMFTT